MTVEGGFPFVGGECQVIGRHDNGAARAGEEYVAVIDAYWEDPDANDGGFTEGTAPYAHWMDTSDGYLYGDVPYLQTPDDPGSNLDNAVLGFRGEILLTEGEHTFGTFGDDDTMIKILGTSGMWDNCAGGSCTIFDDGVDGGFYLPGCCHEVSATVNIPEDDVYEIRGYCREGTGGYYFSTAHLPGRHSGFGESPAEALPIGLPMEFSPPRPWVEEVVDEIHFQNTGGNDHNLGARVPAPGDPGGNQDEFGVAAFFDLDIQEAGPYTIISYADDQSRIRVTDPDGNPVPGESAFGIAGATADGFDIGGCCNDGGAVFNLGVGVYSVKYLMWENGGGAYGSLFIAKGAHDRFNSAFQPVGRQDSMEDRAGLPIGEESCEIGPTGGQRVIADSNGDGNQDISDATHLLGHLFAGGPAPDCGTGPLDVAGSDPRALGFLDVNGSGTIDLSDPVYYLQWLFAGGLPPVQGAEAGACVAVEGCATQDACP